MRECVPQRFTDETRLRIWVSLQYHKSTIRDTFEKAKVGQVVVGPRNTVRAYKSKEDAWKPQQCLWTIEKIINTFGVQRKAQTELSEAHGDQLEVVMENLTNKELLAHAVQLAPLFPGATPEICRKALLVGQTGGVAMCTLRKYWNDRLRTPPPGAPRVALRTMKHEGAGCKICQVYYNRERDSQLTHAQRQRVHYDKIAHKTLCANERTFNRCEQGHDIWSIACVRMLLTR